MEKAGGRSDGYAILEAFQLGGRLQRGRKYARDGQVLSIEIEKGRIRGKVQGSRPTPYEVQIHVKKLSEESWIKVAEEVSSQAVFASKLLGGQMPHEMEEVFRAAGVSLFPENYRDLKTECSCPDSGNPCKHIAAVYYLLGEEFDRDPFLIFKMRGMTREEFLASLGESTSREMPAAMPPEPLPAAGSLFWKIGPLPGDLVGEAPQGVTRAALPRRLGKFPFWRGTADLFEFLDRVYESSSRGGIESEPAQQQVPEQPEAAASTSRRSVR